MKFVFVLSDDSYYYTPNGQKMRFLQACHSRFIANFRVRASPLARVAPAARAGTLALAYFPQFFKKSAIFARAEYIYGKLGSNRFSDLSMESFVVIALAIYTPDGNKLRFCLVFHSRFMANFRVRFASRFAGGDMKREACRRLYALVYFAQFFRKSAISAHAEYSPIANSSNLSNISVAIAI